jgi:hypothetical protein
MRAHIMANQDAFLKGQPSNHSHGAHSSPYHRPSAVPPPAPSPSQMPPNGHNFRQQSFSKGVPAPSSGLSHTTLGQLPRPAIKAQYLPPIQAQAHPQQFQPLQQPQPPQPKPQQIRKPQEIIQPPNQNSKVKTATVFKPYKVSTWNSR